MHRVIISAPFGNYLQPLGCTATIGTYTWQYRGNLLYRIWRMIRTLRPLCGTKGWRNKLGLPNPGIRSLRGRLAKAIGTVLSVHGLDPGEWLQLADEIRDRQLVSRLTAIELNFSCPNVAHKIDVCDVMDACFAFETLVDKVQIIAKLPPVNWHPFIRPVLDSGIKTFHCFNTIPTRQGGVSGYPLRPYVLWALDDLRQRYADDIQLIAGGGVYTVEDGMEYFRAGADHVAIGSALLNPLRWKLPTQLATVASAYFEERACARADHTPA